MRLEDESGQEEKVGLVCEVYCALEKPSKRKALKLTVNTENMYC